MTWEKINNMNKFDKMLNNFGAYNEITTSDEERAAKAASQELWAYTPQ